MSGWSDSEQQWGGDTPDSWNAGSSPSSPAFSPVSVDVPAEHPLVGDQVDTEPSAGRRSRHDKHSSMSGTSNSAPKEGHQSTALTHSMQGSQKSSSRQECHILSSPETSFRPSHHLDSSPKGVAPGQQSSSAGSPAQQLHRQGGGGPSEQQQPSPSSRTNPAGSDKVPSPSTNPERPQQPSSQHQNKSPDKSKDSPQSGGSTPDKTCSICLGGIDNKSFTDRCFHTFCFTCLSEWSKVKAVCPLCKQPFKTIIYNIRTLTDYDVKHIPTPEQVARRRFRYRTTLGSHSTDQLRQRYAEFTARVSSRFGALPTRPTPLWRQQAGTSSEFRKRIYMQSLRIKELRTLTGTEPRYREVTPEFFRRNPACTHRLVPWLNRELNVLLYNHVDHIMYVMDLILSLIKRYAIQSAEFAEHLRPFLGSRTAHFQHEFLWFAKSPYDMSKYDRHAVYESAPPHLVESSTSSSDDMGDDYFSLSTRTNRHQARSRRGVLNEAYHNQVPPVLPLFDPPSTISDPLGLRHSPGGPSRSRPRITTTIRFVRATGSNDRLADPGTSQEGWGSPLPGPSGLSSLNTADNEVIHVGDSSDSQDTVSAHDEDQAPSRGPCTTSMSQLPVADSGPIVIDPDVHDSPHSSHSSDIMCTGFDKPWEERSPIALLTSEDEEALPGQSSQERADRDKSSRKRKVPNDMVQLGKEKHSSDPEKKRRKHKEKKRHNKERGEGHRSTKTKHKHIYTATSTGSTDIRVTVSHSQYSPSHDPGWSYGSSSSRHLSRSQKPGGRSRHRSKSRESGVSRHRSRSQESADLGFSSASSDGHRRHRHKHSKHKKHKKDKKSRRERSSRERRESQERGHRQAEREERSRSHSHSNQNAAALGRGTQDSRVTSTASKHSKHDKSKQSSDHRNEKSRSHHKGGHADIGVRLCKTASGYRVEDLDSPEWETTHSSSKAIAGGCRDTSSTKSGSFGYHSDTGSHGSSQTSLLSPDTGNPGSNRASVLKKASNSPIVLKFKKHHSGHKKLGAPAHAICTQGPTKDLLKCKHSKIEFVVQKIKSARKSLPTNADAGNHGNQAKKLPVASGQGGTSALENGDGGPLLVSPERLEIASPSVLAANPTSINISERPRLKFTFADSGKRSHLDENKAV